MSVSRAGEIQTIGNYGQSSSECNNHKGCCHRLWRCLYGQMASDGTGGTLRIYGYPRPRCCGCQPCEYPLWSTGGVCPTPFPR
jgi:hypothetical protein